jgi:hypothetical protein
VHLAIMQERAHQMPKELGRRGMPGPTVRALAASGDAATHCAPPRPAGGGGHNRLGGAWCSHLPRSSHCSRAAFLWLRLACGFVRGSSGPLRRVKMAAGGALGHYAAHNTSIMVSPKAAGGCTDRSAHEPHGACCPHLRPALSCLLLQSPMGSPIGGHEVPKRAGPPP